MLKGISFARVALAFAALWITVMMGPLQGARASTLETIHTFCSKRDCADGAGPVAGLIQDLAGNFYGIADGNSGGTQTVFELSPQPTGKLKYTVLFSCEQCLLSRSRLIVDTAGNLYTTQPDADNIVEFPYQAGQNKRRMRVIYTFSIGGANGYYPVAGLTYAGAASGLPYDGVSPLYGTTFQGGSQNLGVVYQLTPGGGTWTEQVIYNFCGTAHCSDGSEPLNAPVIDGSGNLFGVTRAGGATGNGTIYELSNGGGTWNLTVLHDNCQQRKCQDGAPFGDLILDASGNIFGVSPYGGSHHVAGVVFKLVPSGTSSAYSVLYEFCAVPRNCRDGAYPVGPLLMDSSGNLFGITSQGGGHDIDPNHSGGGTVFELSGSTLTTLYAFCDETDCRDGAYPNGGLAMDSGGNLFGTTAQGGRHGEGTVFEITP